MRLYDNGDFLLHNFGNRPIYVDGKSLLKGDRASLQSNSVIEICLLVLHFTRNENYKKSAIQNQPGVNQQPQTSQHQAMNNLQSIKSSSVASPNTPSLKINSSQPSPQLSQKNVFMPQNYL